MIYCLIDTSKVVIQENKKGIQEEGELVEEGEVKTETTVVQVG